MKLVDSITLFHRVFLRKYNLSLVGQFPSTYNINLLATLRDIRHVVCLVAVITIHEKILKSKSKSPIFSSYRIKTI